jgi:Rieske Fe-S protein
MDRREFAKNCMMCIGGSALAAVLTNCQSVHYTAGTVEANGISFPASEFAFQKNDQPAFREYVIVRNNDIEFPIYVYRFSEKEYSALLMKCTHQGNELQASGDHLHCSAHGSEFNNRGTMVQGPAERNLRTFKVIAEGDRIFIDLRV